MKKIIIIGCSGNSLAIINSIYRVNTSSSNLKILGFIDDIAKNGLFNYPVLETIKNHKINQDYFYINGISTIESFKSKIKIIERFKNNHAKFISIIDPTAYISENTQIGQGVYIGANTFIGSESRIGDHCLFLQNTTINHHCIIGDHVTISSNVSILGYTLIGNGCFIGAGTNINPKINIENNVVIGSSSNIVKDCKSNKLFYGNPAKEISNLDENFGIKIY